ncbi:MAG: PLP-dependent aminotransferase family protein [Pseudomonadota bacterium]
MSTIWPDSLPKSNGPKYTLVADTIRKSIANGVLQSGAKLPPVRELAFQLSITPGTVARAYTILTDEGLLEAVVGRGTFVADPRKPVPDDIWAREVESAGQGTVRLFSPLLPDVGQVAAIRAALKIVAEGPAEDFLNYPSRTTYCPARQAVVEWLSDVPLGRLEEQDIVLSHGGQNAISLVFQAVLHGPKPVILIEDLSYAGFRRAAEILRADTIGLPMDEHGVIPEALDAAARQHKAQVFCTSPEVQNPTACHTPLDRREALVRVARKHDMQILEDDCYRMGAVRAPSYRALCPDRGWHVSSISKTLTPALRVGFAIAPRGRGGDLRRVAEYGFFGLARPLAEVTRLLLSDPKNRVLGARVRDVVAEYVMITVNALGGFDLSWHRDVPFIWLRLPAGWRAAAFCRAAEARGIQIRSADEFALRDGRAPHAVRIAINARVPKPIYEDAMQQLRALLDSPPDQINV